MQTVTTLKSRKSPIRHVTLRLRRSNTNQANYNALGRNLKIQRVENDSLDQRPVYDHRLTVDEEDSTEYNNGTKMILESEHRAKYYMPHFDNYMSGLDDSVRVDDEKIKGLIIHYPGQSALALDPTTELQYGMFPAIKAVTTDVNQPILLITVDGFQQIRADDLREKYEAVLSRIFTKS